MTRGQHAGLKSAPERPPRRALLMKFFGLYALTVLIAAGAGWLAFHVQIKRELDALSAQEETRLKIAAHVLDNGIQQIISDLYVLTGSPGLSEYLERSDAQNRQRVANSYLNFARSKQIYDQIRYLDETGMEKIRVNWNNGKPAEVPDGELQNKGGRYYFQDAWQLESGEIFISPLDLNIEHGQIEQPLKPMIRFAATVFDHSGRRRGVVLLNYLAGQLLRDFRGHLDPAGGMLLNRNGYWLSAPSTEDEWGFMFENGHRFDSRYPQIWETVSREEYGAILSGDGLFMFTTVYPLRSGRHTSFDNPRAFAASESEQPSKKYCWKVLTHLPTAALPRIASGHYAEQWILLIFALLLLAMLEWGLLAFLFARNRSRQSLEESERRLREITDTLAEGVCELDPAGNIVFINQEACRLLGFSATELLSRNAHQMFHHHYANGEKFEQDECPIYRSTINGRVYRSDDDVFWHKDGTPLPVTVSASPILRDTRGTGTVVAFHDISARKQAEEYRLRNEERLQKLLKLGRTAPELNEREMSDHALDIAVNITRSQVGYLHFINDDQETINLITWNHEARKYCTAAYDSHYPISEAGVWADAARFKHPVVHNDYPAMENKKGQPEGHFPLLRHMSAPVLDGDKVHMIIGVGNKQTPYDDADLRQLHLVAVDLWKIVIRRRIELELEQARQAAETANRAKSAFLANMSHELRTPLNAVLGYAQILLRDSSLNKSQAQSVASIRRSGNYLLLLINDVLDLAKIEAGRLALNPGSCALEAFFSELSEIFRLRAKDKGIALRYQAGGKLPEAVEIDEKRLRQVCMNLLGNALKFTEQGEVRLETDYRSAELIIRVKDTGIGIPLAQHKEIFKPFRQTGEDQYKQQGTGLGLAISLSLVKQMQGRIELESKEGAGSSFIVYLPAPMLSAASLPAAEPAAVFAAVTGYRRLDSKTAPFRVLAADDNLTNRDVLRGLLEPLGFVVSEAADGAEVVTLTETQRFDVILMDLVMPNLDGLNATRHILACPGTANRLIIAVSARAFEENRAESLAAGCSAHLNKPLDSEQLLQVLQALLPLEWEYSTKIPVAAGLAESPPADTPALPAKWFETLEQAVIDGSRTQILSLLDQLSQQNAGLGATLKAWVERYEYQRLLDWIEKNYKSF
ncbi:MAG: GAF domain-containing protein [Gammaproteobacteria bacterium]|nr:GAF domain-containing protein [Gammaproteobacteria bacterium]